MILSPNHPLADSKIQEIDLRELKNEELILFNKDYVLHDLVISSCKVAGFTPRIITESSRWDLLRKWLLCQFPRSLSIPESLCLHYL